MALRLYLRSIDKHIRMELNAFSVFESIVKQVGLQIPHQPKTQFFQVRYREPRYLHLRLHLHLLYVFIRICISASAASSGLNLCLNPYLHLHLGLYVILHLYPHLYLYYI